MKPRIILILSLGALIALEKEIERREKVLNSGKRLDSMPKEFLVIINRNFTVTAYFKIRQRNHSEYT